MSAANGSRGFLLSDGRRAGFCVPTRAWCVAGHRLKSANLILGDAVVACVHRPQEGHARCGILHYVQRWLTAAVQGTELWLVVEITEEQSRRIARARSALEKAEILGMLLGH